MAGSILTIGYGNRSLEELLLALRTESVQYLVDVRSSPRSRFKPEFSAEPLDAALRASGIRYVFMGESLGGRPSDTTCYENGYVVYERVQKRVFFQEGIQRLLNALDQSLKICLLCSEGRPADCHRSKLIGVALEALRIEVVHLDQNGQRVCQADVIKSLESLQGDLFESHLRSRKSYNKRAITGSLRQSAGHSGDD